MVTGEHLGRSALTCHAEAKKVQGIIGGVEEGNTEDSSKIHISFIEESIDRSA